MVIIDCRFDNFLIVLLLYNSLNNFVLFILGYFFNILSVLLRTAGAVGDVLLLVIFIDRLHLIDYIICL
jgi:hypothetical protein